MLETMTTGAAARLIAKAVGKPVSEPRLQDLMRRRKIPTPISVAGKRRWTRAQVDHVVRWMRENDGVAVVSAGR